ncbi:MAG TPA: PqqD family protein [Nitrospiraceae bacterium]|nr:PqqD family protein [Nitrospiraceae bacterium]
MRYRIPEDVVSREVGGEAVLLNLATGTYFGLDGVGTEIWNLLAREGTIEGVTHALLAGYDVEEPRLRHDIEQFIQQLMHKGLLAIEPDK